MQQQLEFDLLNNTLVFKGPYGGGKQSSVTVRNPTDSYIAFKIKTTIPQLCTVRPNEYMLDPKGEVTVNFIFSPTVNAALLDWTRHKFMLQSIKSKDKFDINRLDYVISRNKDEVMVTRWNSELEASVKAKEGEINEDSEVIIKYKKAVEEAEKALEMERKKTGELQKELEIQKEKAKKIDEDNTEQSLSFWEVPYTDLSTDGATGGYISQGHYKDQPVTIIKLCQPSADGLPSLTMEDVSILTKPRHPCLLLFMAVSYDPSKSLIIVTEPIECSLREACTESSKLDFSSRVNVMIDVGRALYYLHTHTEAITHKNVNCGNVFIYQAFGGYRGKLSCTNVNSASSEVKQPPEVRNMPYKTITTKIDVYFYGMMLMEVFKIPKGSNEQKFPLLKLPTIYEETRKCTEDNPDDRPDIIDVLHVMKSILVD